MYAFSSPIDVTVAPGTNLLVAARETADARSLALDTLVEGITDGDSGIIVTTEAIDVLGDIYQHTDTKAPLGVVDCRAGSDHTLDIDANTVTQVTAPDELTEMGIALSELLEAFTARETDRVRVVFHSLSTLLAYNSLETVFRFIHVCIGRVEAAGGVGLYTVDTTAHDTQSLTTLRQLFDGHITVPEAATDAVDVTMR